MEVTGEDGSKESAMASPASGSDEPLLMSATLTLAEQLPSAVTVMSLQLATGGRFCNSNAPMSEPSPPGAFGMEGLSKGRGCPRWSCSKTASEIVNPGACALVKVAVKVIAVLAVITTCS